MLAPRVIPVLLIQERKLVKGVRFRDHKYVGDPMNAIRIFNTKEVDELILIDITATEKHRAISVDFVKKVSSECLMPFAVGGGIRTLAQAKDLFAAGAEKITLGSIALEDPSVIRAISDCFGSQGVVVSLDVRKTEEGTYEVYTHNGTYRTGRNAVSVAKEVVSWGAGEILLNHIDRDGTMLGYDTELIKLVADSINIPVIALGGAGKLEHFSSALNDGKASAVAAGSYFVFYGSRRAVLINYPMKNDLQKLLTQ